MDQTTLNRLCAHFPAIDFRQTYGMSELGILRVKSEAPNSLWMKVGGDGVETRVTAEGVLQIASATRMLGYMNAPSPFTDGWYDTGDLVETKEGGYIRIIGRSKEIINIGGIKILPGEIERVGLDHPLVLRCIAKGVANPITGQHIEVTCQLRDGAELSRSALRDHFRRSLPQAVWPHRVAIGEVPVNHRFKQMG
jgi:acyl-CoA synthetase (AMP-forming)/AMP-acid ligase II